MIEVRIRTTTEPYPIRLMDWDAANIVAVIPFLASQGLVFYGATDGVEEFGSTDYLSGHFVIDPVDKVGYYEVVLDPGDE